MQEALSKLVGTLTVINGLGMICDSNGRLIALNQTQITRTFFEGDFDLLPKPAEASLMVKPNQQHMGHTLDELTELKPITIDRLRQFGENFRKENNIDSVHLTEIDLLIILHNYGNQSLKSLARKIGIYTTALTQIFSSLSLPRLTPDESRQRYYNTTSPAERKGINIGRWYADNVSPERKKEISHKSGTASMKLRSTEEIRILGRKARRETDMPKSDDETIMATILQEMGIYAEYASEAKVGEVYFCESKINKFYITDVDQHGQESDHYPDFRVKGRYGVFEIYHGKKNKRAQKRFDRKMEVYQKYRFKCKVFKGEDLADKTKRQAIIEEISQFIEELDSEEIQIFPDQQENC